MIRIVKTIIEKEYRYVYYHNENGALDKIVVPVDANREVVHRLMAEYGAREPVVLERRVVSPFEVMECVPDECHYSWGPLPSANSEGMDFSYDDDGEDDDDNAMAGAELFPPGWEAFVEEITV